MLITRVETGCTWFSVSSSHQRLSFADARQVQRNVSSTFFIEYFDIGLPESLCFGRILLP